jgi:hypothetical protein
MTQWTVRVRTRRKGIDPAGFGQTASNAASIDAEGDLASTRRCRSCEREELGAERSIEH